MGRCRFVQPGIVRLSLTDDEWIDVKRELNAGEQRRVMAGYVKEMRSGEAATIDPERVGKTRLLEYIVGWSFTGFTGQPEPFDESALDCLDMDTYNELVDALDAHDAQISAAREARKKNRVGATTSPATSRSPFAVDGVLSGSEP
jgi:membrane-bound lytic murein transglycosylase MltF